MSKSRTFVTVIVASSLIVGGAVSLAQFSSTQAGEHDMRGLSDTELIEVFDNVAASKDEALGGAVTDELLRRRGTMAEDVLVDAIADSSHERVTRGTMIEILLESGEPITGEIRALLDDPAVELELKARIVALSRFTSADADLLERLAARADSLGFQALKKLTGIAPERADALATQVLAKPDGASDLQISGALKARVRSGALHDDADALAGFVRQAIGIAQNQAASNELRDAAVLALAELREIVAIRAIIDARLEDRVMVAGAIDQNYDVLANSLQEKPTDAEVAIVVTAMELHPVKDLAAPLQRVRSTVTDAGLRERIDKVLQILETEGVPGNIKWTEG